MFDVRISATLLAILGLLALGRTYLRRRSRRKAEAKPDVPPALGVAHGLRVIRDAEDDDHYKQFVDEMWASSDARPVRVRLERNGEDSFVRSIVDRPGTIYVNTLEAGERKTYVADRHRWTRDGLKVSDAGFRAILFGVPPDEALRFNRPPASVEEALAPANNHLAAENSLVINYRDAEGEDSYRVISEIRRGDDRFTSRCHWRWGERRTFLYGRLIRVINPVDGKEIPIEQFRTPRKPFGTLAKRLRRKRA
jgi:hypothetical protein